MRFSRNQRAAPGVRGEIGREGLIASGRPSAKHSRRPPGDSLGRLPAAGEPRAPRNQPARAQTSTFTLILMRAPGARSAARGSELLIQTEERKRAELF